MANEWIYYFGYGSLVNRETRPVGEVANTAKLRGWRRVWEHRVTEPHRGQRCTSLSIEPLALLDEGSIDGVVVRLPVADLSYLDERELGYERLTLPTSNFDLPACVESDVVMVYRSLPYNRIASDSEYPVLQSYIDCVMAGYLQRFGGDGVELLVKSTRGWNGSILNDREHPYYPRAVDIDLLTQQLFDQSILSAVQMGG